MMRTAANEQTTPDPFDEMGKARVPRNKAVKTTAKAARQGTFTDNMKLPIHRWIRYSAGFSAEWVENLISKEFADRKPVILDPFAGSGTTLIAAEKAGVYSIGLESHPFVYRLASAKLRWHEVTTSDFLSATNTLIRSAREYEENIDISNAAPLLVKCYTPDSLRSLFSLKNAYEALPEKASAINNMLWLAITSILRSCSYVGTAQWQYILPNKRKAVIKAPYAALKAKAEDIAEDILLARKGSYSCDAAIILHDTRKRSGIMPATVDFVVTSPPYPNNYDYADATRLEMTFWGEIETWGDLQQTVRQYIVRSCSQHSAADKLILEDLLQRKELQPITTELRKVCEKLGEVRLEKGGKKTYHTMVAAYFLDLAQIFVELRRLCRSGARMCFVIGDSAPYGIYVPVDKWLGDLAIAAGFKSYRFDKIRDRNTKWKNRKHTVPLHEGCLWIEG